MVLWLALAYPVLPDVLFSGQMLLRERSLYLASVGFCYLVALLLSDLVSLFSYRATGTRMYGCCLSLSLSLSHSLTRSVAHALPPLPTVNVGAQDVGTA